MEEVIKVDSKKDISNMKNVDYLYDCFQIFIDKDDCSNIPHFHYKDSVGWSKFHTCICIESATYFYNDGKGYVLNSKQRRELQEFMESPISLNRYKEKFSNNWELVCFLWNLNNSNVKVGDCEQPDYTKLK